MSTREDWPRHRPAAPDAPIPGRHWFAGCGEPGSDHRVSPDGICEDCGSSACPKCGCERYPDGKCECP